MKDFIFAALPFIVVGICLALLAANHNRIKDSEEKNHMTEGMCIGMCFGLLLDNVGIFSGFGMCIGMALGLLIGTYIQKGEDEQ